jgi:hypothetical protein
MRNVRVGEERNPKQSGAWHLTEWTVMNQRTLPTVQWRHSLRSRIGSTLRSSDESAAASGHDSGSGRQGKCPGQEPKTQTTL